MKVLSTGQFFGETNSIADLAGLTVTDTVYTHEKVDWHYHEKPYFTFILQGNVIEGNKKETYHCSQGSLLFHNWDDAHFNIKPPGFTRGFHIEIDRNWFEDYDINIKYVQGSISVKNPEIQLLFYKLFKESKINDSNCTLSMNTLLIEVLDKIKNHNKTSTNLVPYWVKTLKEMLHEEPIDDFSLLSLAKILDIHPVHLSRYFPKYFGCSLGEYIRKIKVKKSLAMLSDCRNSLIEIALETGFSDQSHFNRCFKENMGITPLTYQKLIL